MYIKPRTRADIKNASIELAARDFYNGQLSHSTFSNPTAYPLHNAWRYYNTRPNIDAHLINATPASHVGLGYGPQSGMGGMGMGGMGMGGMGMMNPMMMVGRIDMIVTNALTATL